MGSKSKRGYALEWTRERRRQKFIALYNANPCNFLPARVLHLFYRQYSKTSKLNAAAAQWLKANPQPGWKS